MWNKDKSNKWQNLQPILSPTSLDFEERVIYNKELNIFQARTEGDVEAINLVEILKLDDPDLSNERKRYLKRMKEFAEAYGISMQEFVNKLIRDNHFEHISFIRSIEEEFKIDVWNMIPEITE